MIRYISLAIVSLMGLSALATAETPAQDAARVEQILRGMSLAEKLDYLGGTGFATKPIESAHVPPFVMSDGASGLRTDHQPPATAFGAGLALAASWDTDLARRVGATIGAEARGLGIHYLLAPGLNMYRSPLNGRNFEYYGEDPYLASRIAVGFIDGVQSQGVSAVAKHFVGNDSEYDRHRTDSIIDARSLHEIYLAPFEAAVREAHVGGVIDGYNMLNGRYMSQNPDMNIELLRRQRGFRGVLMSDWVGTHDGVAAANAGLDLEMPVGEYLNAKTLLPAIAAGTVSEASIDDKIRHSLANALRFGWLDRPQRDPARQLPAPDGDALALQEAREGVVLLKNDHHLLPLDRAHIHTILVTGPDADPGIPTGGGSVSVKPAHAVSVLEAMRKLAGPGIAITYDRGIPTLETIAAQTSFFTDSTGNKPGVRVEHFANGDLSGNPARIDIVPHIVAPGVSWSDFIDDPAAIGYRFSNWRNHHASRRWTGYYRAAQSGQYVIALRGSGEWNANRVTLDGRTIIDNWRQVRAYEPAITLTLSAGPHKLVVEDAENGPLGERLLVGIAPEDGLVSQKALDLARKADAVIAVVGFDRPSESEGGDRSFNLPVGQDSLLRKLATANSKLIVAIVSGGGIEMQAWLDRAPACLQAWYAGQQAGTAIAETFLGDNNPSGRLPVTFGRRLQDTPGQTSYYPFGTSNRVIYAEGVFVGYRGYERNGTTPLFPFGFGLSYTSFAFAHLQVTPVATHEVHVAFDVTNTGTRAGSEVAQIYVGADHPSLPSPAHALKGFVRCALGPGETRHVTVNLPESAFAYWNIASSGWTVDPGPYHITIGDSATDPKLKASVNLRWRA